MNAQHSHGPLFTGIELLLTRRLKVYLDRASPTLMTYVPKPIPTKEIKLPDGLDDLTERLAEHIHDTWALQRMSEGWVYGPARNDDTKTHPGLVPYEDLSEAEKNYDRRTALEALRAIVALGYRIVPPE